MLKTQKLVHDMMVALELPLPNEDGPSIEGLSRLNFGLLIDLVYEEAHEFNDEMDRLFYLIGVERAGGRLLPHEVTQQWVKVIDAICDTIVVLHNTSNAMGIDLEPFFEEVHRTNMAKAGGPKRADGKAMKPEGWTGPRIEAMLEGVLAPNCAGCRFLIPTGHVDEGICHNTESIHIGGFRSSSKGACCWKELAKGTVCLCSRCGKLLDVVEAVDENGAVVPIPARVFCGECSKDEKPLTLKQTMDLMGAEPAPMPPGAKAVLSMLGVRTNPCCHIQCGEGAKFGLLRAGDSQELHYHVCAAHLQEFVEDAEHCTVWVLED